MLHILTAFLYELGRTDINHAILQTFHYIIIKKWIHEAKVRKLFRLTTKLREKIAAAEVNRTLIELRKTFDKLQFVRNNHLSVKSNSPGE